MALLGPLDPTQQQAQQRAAVTAQSQHWEDELTKMLRERGQRQEQPFTSPWQVAGQMAQALSGRMHAGQNAQNYAALNANLAPGEDQGEAPPSSPMADASPQQAPPHGAGAPTYPRIPYRGESYGNAPPAPADESMPTKYSSGTHKYKEFTPEIKQAIQQGAQLAGVDPQMIAEFAHFESDGDPSAHKRGSQYKGLLQVNDAEMARHSGGRGNVWNPVDSARVGGLMAKENAAAYQKFTGRQPSNFDLYMMHQQGPAGYLQHIGNPNAPAIQNMLGTEEGRSKGAGWAHQAIVENGGHANDTSAQFIQRWRNKYAQVQRGDFAPAGQQTAQATGSPLGAAAPPGAPGTPQAGAPGLIETGRFFGQGGYPAPQATYDPARLNALARSGMLSPEEIDKFKQQQIQAQQPRTREVPGMGTFMLDPHSGQETYIPTIQTKTLKAAGGNEIPYQFYVNSRGQEVPIGQAGGAGAGGLSGGPEDQLRHIGSVGNDIAAEGAAKKLQAEVGPAAQKAGAEAAAKVPAEVEAEAGKTRVSGQEKEFESIRAGITGAGYNYSQQAPNIKSLLDLAPRAHLGTGSGVMLELNRFADKIGLSKRAAAPQELFKQLATKILADQFSSIRNSSMAEGSPAARVFKTMLDVEEKANITEPDSFEGTVSKLKRMQNMAKYGMKWADDAGDYTDAHGRLDNKFMKNLRKEISEADYDEGVEAMPSAGGAAEKTKTIRGKTYYQRNGHWYEE